MIYIGESPACKVDIIEQYRQNYQIKRVVVLTPEKFRFECEGETVLWPDIIRYTYFYRLLQEIDSSTLVVVNECLRTQNRYDLTYNCIRHFLNQTTHQLIFQYLPVIADIQDFMILFDFETRSRWKREKFNQSLLSEYKIECKPHPIKLQSVPVEVSTKTESAYCRERKRLFNSIGLKDPHTIPRNLYLLSGKDKLKCASDGWHIGRNNRFKMPTLQTYKEHEYNHSYTVFELCHNFIDFADVVVLSQQTQFDVMVANLKVDHWYFERYTKWAEVVTDAYSKIWQH